ncbi:DUF2975 domain-containing protein [Paenilisteria rocourtiae]|uniref:DUF2975 family protein n=1 Tax=Listeria rocourtiae TaxID=647910 RepID=A0A4R6ZP34_9LIST|nr:DUF2975 domain-containing protein [Listeria rocourtiae]EUJ51742.1 hypothetical protein PROCOU_01147 [Listeria rocourtiae FSL F6-920]MBC1434250.1 DUF2975 domain-containing protein [Listeria rocourtiae]MBC1603772.1 DUF2975 domain-containing protein [Listeria rocourtiae]TDR54132.1 hypothetical protein DFP96_103231 [Listeria rocourtiae]
MKHGSTFLLRLIILFIGLVILVLCVLGLPSLAMDKSNPEFTRRLYPILITMWIAAVPFFIGLYQGLKVLAYIDKKTAFSELSVRALKHVKYCALIISTLYFFSLPFFYLLAQHDDAPGLVVIGLVLTFGSIVVATFAAVLQKLLQEAVAIKSENDLTV